MILVILSILKNSSECPDHILFASQLISSILAIKKILILVCVKLKNPNISHLCSKFVFSIHFQATIYNFEIIWIAKTSLFLNIIKIYSLILCELFIFQQLKKIVFKQNSRHRAQVGRSILKIKSQLAELLDIVFIAFST